MAAALGDLERASWLMTWGVLCRNSKLSIRRTCVCVSVILHPSWTHILIFRPSEKGAVSSENETHLGEKAGSIVLALGEGNPANGMSCGELSAHLSGNTIPQDNTHFHKIVSDTILMPQITVNQSCKELFLN